VSLLTIKDKVFLGYCWKHSPWRRGMVNYFAGEFNKKNKVKYLISVCLQ
jgi:hypothetical protein